MPIVRGAAAGPAMRGWQPPVWLMPHQVSGAQRIAGALRAFGGAFLSDAVGLGKTYVALAVATRYQRVTVAVPAALASQWSRVGKVQNVQVSLITHEALSRGAGVPECDLLVVDEAHRFRNPGTRRYDRLCQFAPRSHILLLTATPVVNHPGDLVHLLRLFLPDHGLALFGVPSLDHAVQHSDLPALCSAVAPLIVARSPDSIAAFNGKIPSPHDSAILDPTPVPTGELESLIPAVQALRFPTFAGSPAADLLRLHLLHRLASSAAACRATLRRHRHYLDSAVEASGRSSTLSRSEWRRLVGPEESAQLDFELLLLAPGHQVVPVDWIQEERARIDGLISRLDGINGGDPKAETLTAVLRTRGNRKTIVFTTAIETAFALANRLGWRRVAVVTGRGARIASGRIPVDEALALFAPAARGGGQVQDALRLSHLIATDLVSEGLDLQDADAIVHFDLPWTALRLEQRLGRIARLGSSHRSVEVWWFAPPPQLEHYLRLTSRIGAKSDCQLRLAVPRSSRVGRAAVGGSALEWRERVVAQCDPASVPGSVHAVVRGPRVVAAAVDWLVGPSVVPQLLVISGDRPTGHRVSGNPPVARMLGRRRNPGACR